MTCILPSLFFLTDNRTRCTQYNVIDCVFLGGQCGIKEKYKIKEWHVDPTAGVAIAVTAELAPGHVCAHVYVCMYV